MSARLTSLKQELERKNRLIRLLLDRIDVQTRQIAALEASVASVVDLSPSSEGAKPAADAAKAGAQ